MVELDKFFFEINSWSYTRHRTWNRCQRQYYFDYIAPYVKPPALVDANIIRLLKAFNSKFVLQGQLIHDILDEQIKLYCDKKPMDPAGAASAYSRKIAQNKMMASEVLTEFRNGEPVKDSFFTTIDEGGKACLNTFFETIWPVYQDRECLRHEEYDHFNIGDVGVTVKVDFVGRMPDGTLVLTDWKTGRDDDEYETELQMAAYVLWAMQYFKKSADEIGTELVFLKTGEKKPYAFFEERLREVEEMIKREFVAMNTSYEYGDFPARPSVRECLSCKFARVCPEATVVRK
jgi:CRISPR/Cas system-associated exonuclease Cas4 (RecB family)